MTNKNLISEIHQLQKIAGILREDTSSDLKKVQNFVYSHPSYEHLSPIKLKKVISYLTQEWEASKSNYNSIEDYFQDLEQTGGLDNLDEGKTISVDDIDFGDDGNRDAIFTLNASDEDIENFEQGNVETVFENDDYGGTFGVYKLPTGEYMYAFPDAEFYIKAPKGVKIVH